MTRFAQKRSAETTQDSFLSSRRLETVGMLGGFVGRTELVFVRRSLLHGQLFSDTSWEPGVSIALDVIIYVKVESRPGRISSYF